MSLSWKWYIEIRSYMMAQKWTKQKVVSAIRKRHGERITLVAVFVRNENRSLHTAALYYFGNWGNALRAAGYNPTQFNRRGVRKDKEKWTREAVIDVIRLRFEKGERLNTLYMAQHHGSVWSAAYHLLGGWREAVEFAGIDYSQVTRRFSKWDKKRVIKEIRKRFKLGLPLADGAAPSQLTSPGRRLFGTWLNAIRAAGLSYHQITKARGRRHGWWTRKRVLMRIRQLEKSGVRLNSKNIQTSDAGLHAVASVFFGDWPNAVIAAGIDYNKHRLNWSARQWLDQLSEREYKSVIKKAKAHAKRRNRR